MAKDKRGFASMNPARQRQIASMGGKAAHAKGTAHRFDPEEGRIAGRKGGKSHSAEYMRELGRKGGLVQARRRYEQEGILPRADSNVDQSQSGPQSD